MIVREIRLEDAEQFLNLTKNIDQSGFMLYEPGERTTTIEEQQRIINRILNEDNSNIFVAEINDQLVGYLVAIGGNVTRNKHCAYLVLGVGDDYQGRGIATKLFETLFNWAKGVGITRLELTVIKNNVKAIHLYRKMGFIEEGEKVNSLMINGEYVNEYYFYKLLN